MLYTVGESLDMIVVLSDGQYKSVTLLVQPPFDSSSMLEAQDSALNYFIKIPADSKTIELLADSK